MDPFWLLWHFQYLVFVGMDHYLDLVQNSFYLAGTASVLLLLSFKLVLVVLTSLKTFEQYALFCMFAGYENGQKIITCYA